MARIGDRVRYLIEPALPIGAPLQVVEAVVRNYHPKGLVVCGSKGVHILDAKRDEWEVIA